MRKPSTHNTSSTKEQRQRHLIPIKQAIYIVLAFGMLASSVALFFVEPELARPFFDRPFNIYRCLIMSLAIVFLLLATTGGWLRSCRQSADTPTVNKWLGRLGYLLPILSLIILLIQLIWPEAAVTLVRKESWPFYRNAIFIKAFCQLVGLILFVCVARLYAKNRNWLAMGLSILVVIVLFVMIGEELSWGQRIFGWATPDYFLGNNEQSETNLHNLATQLFQNILYFGGWLLLIGLAFWQNNLGKLLDRNQALRPLISWLPPLSFVLIFATGFGFSDPLHSETGLYYGSNLFIVIATAILLIALCIKNTQVRNNKALCHTLLVLLTYLTVLVCNQLFSHVWDINPGAATEYLELNISFGLMLWAIVVHSRVKTSHNQAKASLTATNN